MQTYKTAKVLLIDSQGKVLLLRRSATHPKEPHHYDLPGGIVEDGEELLTALAREVAEETALPLKPEALELVFTKTEEHEGRIAFRSVYSAHIVEAEPAITLSWEHDDSGWFAPAEAAAKLPRGRYIQVGLQFALEHGLI